jgi:hypothetical protein
VQPVFFVVCCSCASHLPGCTLQYVHPWGIPNIQEMAGLRSTPQVNTTRSMTSKQSDFSTHTVDHHRGYGGVKTRSHTITMYSNLRLPHTQYQRKTTPSNPINRPQTKTNTVIINYQTKIKYPNQNPILKVVHHQTANRTSNQNLNQSQTMIKTTNRRLLSSVAKHWSRKPTKTSTRMVASC